MNSELCNDDHSRRTPLKKKQILINCENAETLTCQLVQEDSDIFDEPPNKISKLTANENELANDSRAFATSTPSKEQTSSDSDREGELQIVENGQDKILIDSEIEEDIERELKSKAEKTNLTVKNVKSILRYVIRNENVLSMIRNSMESANVASTSSERVLCDLPKLTRSKARKLREEKCIPWPLSPIVTPRKVQHDEPNVGILIAGELPDEEDDEEYRPNFEDLNDPSDDETGRLSSMSISSSVNTSTGQNCDSDLLSKSLESKEYEQKHEKQNKTVDVFKKPAIVSVSENIGQRTRSKLSLSNTPLEAIEQAFVPPDITTDMYDFQCDNEEWENFLKEFMLPLPAEEEEEEAADDDPEYNVMADEDLLNAEETDREELRHDRAVKVRPAEVRTLFEELLLLNGEEDEEEDEDEEHDKESTAVCELEVEVEKESEKNNLSEKENHIIDDYCEKDLTETETYGVTMNQLLLLLQQLRQHIQLLTQHFIQTHRHPMFKAYSQTFKTLLAQLRELGKSNKIINVYNLESAFSFVENWERLMMSAKGQKHELHLMEMVNKCKNCPPKRVFRPDFSSLIYREMSESEIFLYPGLLPSQPFRCDNPHRLEFTVHEDMLIALGLEQFTKVFKLNPQWKTRKKKESRAALGNLISKYLMPAKTGKQITRRIKACCSDANNPIGFFCGNKKAPPTVHYIIPFDENFIMPLKQQHVSLLPSIWKVGLDKFTKFTNLNKD